MIKDLTIGSPVKVILRFSIPMMIGNLFQQFYNIADSMIVGRYLGSDALAAVGSSYAVTTFITSIILGLCMGVSVAFSQFFGGKLWTNLKKSIIFSFIMIGGISLLISILSLLFTKQIMIFTNIPLDIQNMTQTYLTTIFCGIPFIFLYNWSANLQRALGNSKAPLIFLIISVIANIIFDIILVVPFQMGIFGAAFATIISQLFSAILSMVYCIKKIRFLTFQKEDFKIDNYIVHITISYSILTSIQQSIMNFGILMVQGLVNSFGTVAIAAFTSASKIDSFAYMPVQDFGNAFATYVAQNKGAKQYKRIIDGMKVSFLFVVIFCAVISSIVYLFAPQLIQLFVTDQEVIQLGVECLHVVCCFYCLIGFLFLFYGIYRGIGNVFMSIVLTVISLGTRVVLAYLMAYWIGLEGVWWSIPIGWFLADCTGILYFLFRQRNKMRLSD